jgi:hypothetical protein
MRTQEMQTRLDELGAARRAYDSDNTLLSYNRIVNAEHEIKHRAVKDVAHLLEINAALLATCEALLSDVESWVEDQYAGTTHYDREMRQLEEYRAVIAKAKGE